MNVINNINDTAFELNGIMYLKNYMSRPYGNKLEIYNCYERDDVLVEQIHYQNFIVDGNTFLSVTDLQVALLLVLYNRNSLNDGNFPDATTTLKGKLKLAGDFDTASTADAPLIKMATTTNAGKVKLYKGLGTNEDGGITQKTATESFTNRILADEVGTDYMSSSSGSMLFKTYTIPANMLTDGVYKFYFGFAKTIGTNENLHTCTYNFYISESPITYTNGIGTVIANSAFGWQTIDRSFIIYSNNGITKLLAGSKQSSSGVDLASSYPIAEYVFNKNVSHFIHVIATSGTSGIPLNPSIVHRLAGGYIVKM